MLSTLDVYESFHLVGKQTDWAKLEMRVEFPDEEGEEATSPRKDPPPPPPPEQIPLCCTCKWNYKWTECEHTGLVASVFSWEYKVPDKLIAATLALRKKTSSIRGTAGVRRKHLLKELAKPTLTEVLYRARLGARASPGPSARPSSALHPAVSRLRPSVKSWSFHSA